MCRRLVAPLWPDLLLGPKPDASDLDEFILYIVVIVGITHAATGHETDRDTADNLSSRKALP
jgi:hypothetical protein